MFGRKTWKALRLYFKYRDISKDVHQIALALINSLIQVKAIKTKRSDLVVATDINIDGVVFCHLEGGTTFEKSTFIKALQETIDVVDNPRYLIIRKNNLFNIVKQKDYHSVPEEIGRKKDSATFFYNEWKKLVGNASLVYTRSIEGRKLLLASRLNSLSSNLQNRTERVNKWK